MHAISKQDMQEHREFLNLLSALVYSLRFYRKTAIKYSSVITQTLVSTLQSVRRELLFDESRFPRVKDNLQETLLDFIILFTK